jgi:hypothetical protein
MLIEIQQVVEEWPKCIECMPGLHVRIGPLLDPEVRIFDCGYVETRKWVNQEIKC